MEDLYYLHQEEKELHNIEEPYFDEKGNEIKEFALIKMFHFIGARRKKYYMYKWVKLVEWKGKLHWVALHLEDNSGDHFHLKSFRKKDGRLIGVEVVQEPYLD